MSSSRAAPASTPGSPAGQDAAGLQADVSVRRGAFTLTVAMTATAGDVVAVLGHNDDPVVPYMGSAIFLHLSQPDYSPTAGCVAIPRTEMEALLKLARPGDAVEIVA